MWTLLAPAADEWASLYANSAVLRTAVGFVHVGGLLVGGGAAIVADRAVIGARPAAPDTRTQRVAAAHQAHRVVIAGLALVIVSGLLLFAADYDSFLRSGVFWLKMGLVGLLLVNGAWLTRTAHRVERGRPDAWRRLQLAAMVSLTLWLLITLLGAALPNV